MLGSECDATRNLSACGGEIVRIITLDHESHRGRLLRVPGSIQLAPLSTFNLLEVFDRLIAWIRAGGKDGPKPADCPMKIAATYLARLDWRLPTLTGVVEAPIMRPDGSILSACGYDAATGLYLQVEADWPKVPDEPTRADALTAANALFQPFAEFPFVDEAARSVFIAAILTAIQRRLLESAPIFAFDAPSQRSGKSLLAEAVGLLATGRKPAATGVSSQPEELRKAITSALRENQPIVNLDNITHVLSSADLARAVTQSEYSDRLLGVNRMLRLPTNILWTATGNNLTVRGDLSVAGRYFVELTRRWNVQRSARLAFPRNPGLSSREQKAIGNDCFDGIARLLRSGTSTTDPDAKGWIPAMVARETRGAGLARMDGPVRDPRKAHRERSGTRFRNSYPFTMA